MAEPIIDIDPNSGFCFGVVKAIEAAESHINQQEQLYCLGDIVHNSMEVKRLEKEGMKTISHSDLKLMNNKHILIRAHGEPPSTYLLAKNNNLNIIDATCPVVLKLQKRVKNSYEYLKSINGQIVIYGQKGHAEVNGLLGQTNNEGIVIESINDISKIDFNRPLHLFAQTTKSIEGFKAIREICLNKINNSLEIKTFDTICRQVSNRAPKLKEFATKYNVIIFVSGKKSSNGKALFKTCQSINPKTHFVTSPDDLEQHWFTNSPRIGICGATSTPKWLMQEIAKRIKVQTQSL